MNAFGGVTDGLALQFLIVKNKSFLMSFSDKRTVANQSKISGKCNERTCHYITTALRSQPGFLDCC